MFGAVSEFVVTSDGAALLFGFFLKTYSEVLIVLLN